jgi:hypothetical protein
MLTNGFAVTRSRRLAIPLSRQSIHTGRVTYFLAMLIGVWCAEGRATAGQKGKLMEYVVEEYIVELVRC